MRLAAMAAILVFAGSTAARTQDQSGVIPTLYGPSPNQSIGEKLPAIPVHSGWSFVGCTSSHHACGHHARSHGFHHHSVRHSHSCSHPHLACYGRN